MEAKHMVMLAGIGVLGYMLIRKLGTATAAMALPSQYYLPGQPQVSQPQTFYPGSISQPSVPQASTPPQSTMLPGGGITYTDPQWGISIPLESLGNIPVVGPLIGSLFGSKDVQKEGVSKTTP